MSDTTTAPIDTTAADPSPGWKSTEFWAKLLLAVLTWVYASGVVTNSTVIQIAGMAVNVLGYLGYTMSRTSVKKANAVASVVALQAAAASAVANANEKATTRTTVNVSSPSSDPAAVAAGVASALKSQSGFAKLGVMLALASGMLIGGIAFSVSGCSESVKDKVVSESKAVGQGTVKCLTPDIKQITDQFGPLVDALLDKATGADGSIDLETVKAGARNLKGDALGCLVASGFSRLLLAIKLGPAPGTASAAQIPTEAAVMTVWTKLKVDNFGGRYFEVEAGTL